MLARTDYTVYSNGADWTQVWEIVWHVTSSYAILQKNLPKHTVPVQSHRSLQTLQAVIILLIIL